MANKRSPIRPSSGRDPDGLSVEQRHLVELAEDWLRAKQLKASDAQVAKGHSDRARRGDLCRIGRLVCFVTGREHRPWGDPGTLIVDLGRCTLADFTTDTLMRAVQASRENGFSPATVRRTLSTLRGFTRWMNARGHLRVDPCAVDELVLPAAARASTPKALLTADVDALRASALVPPERDRETLWWPARDLALIELLSRCGLRADEAVTARVDWIDRRPQVPVLTVVGKGDKARAVPMSRHVVDALDAFFVERAERHGRFGGSAPLLVRVNGQPLLYGVVDRLVRGLAERAAVTLPKGAAAHSLRHHYGTTLALSGVHPSLLSQLMGHEDPKTSEIYTRVASTQLIEALDRAGLL